MVLSNGQGDSKEIQAAARRYQDQGNVIFSIAIGDKANSAAQTALTGDAKRVISVKKECQGCDFDDLVGQILTLIRLEQCPPKQPQPCDKPTTTTTKAPDEKPAGKYYTVVIKALPTVRFYQFFS